MLLLSLRQSVLPRPNHHNSCFKYWPPGASVERNSLSICDTPGSLCRFENVTEASSGVERVKWMKIEIRTSLFLNENFNHFAAPPCDYGSGGSQIEATQLLFCAAVLFWPSTTPTESSLRATETAAASKETGNSASCCHTSCLTEAVDKCCACLRCLAFFPVAYMFRRERLHCCVKKTKQGKKHSSLQRVN